MSQLTGDWKRLDEILNPANIRKGVTQAAARVGNYGASQVKKGIVSGSPGGQTFAPNSPLTIARKGSSSPLIDDGDLVGSITYQIIDDAKSVFIGVKKGVKRKKDGKDIAEIATVHEFGCTIPVTHKMRAYFRYEGINLKASTQYIYIPPRPFLRPVLNSQDFRAKVAEIYIEALERMFHY